MAQQSFETAEKYSLKESISFADGAIVSKIIMKNNAGNVTLFSFDKGQYLSEHTAPFDAMLQVIEGRITVTINAKPSELSEGEMIIMPANIPHAVHAIDRSKVQLTMIRG